MTLDRDPSDVFYDKWKDAEAERDTYQRHSEENMAARDELAREVAKLRDALTEIEVLAHDPVVPTASALVRIARISGTALANNHSDLRDEMVCDRCHRRHGVVWHADPDLWNAVMREGDRGKPDEFSFCCPTCFMQLATERGHGTFFAVAGASYDEEDIDD